MLIQEQIDLKEQWFKAAIEGHVDLLKEINPQRKFHIDTKSKRGYSALLLSIGNGQVDCAKYLEGGVMACLILSS